MKMSHWMLSTLAAMSLMAGVHAAEAPAKQEAATTCEKACAKTCACEKACAEACKQKAEDTKACKQKAEDTKACKMDAAACPAK
jgi:hypothetical protein